MAVQSYGRFEEDVAQFFLQRDLLFDELAILEECLVRGVDGEDPIEPVAYWPVLSLPLASWSPTMAGMRSERAMMAVWDVLLPTSVANPST